jgi:hypothetical protein
MAPHRSLGSALAMTAIAAMQPRPPFELPAETKSAYAAALYDVYVGENTLTFKVGGLPALAAVPGRSRRLAIITA